jgi:putative glycosyltransferase (TIGR04372 family)
MSVPRLFKRPIVWVNAIPIQSVHVWDANSFFILKKLWSKDGKRFLTYEEMLSPQLRNIMHGPDFAANGIEPVANTEEEIADLALEVEERLNSRWQESPEDEGMQLKFWKMYQADNPHPAVLRARIGTMFLRKNQSLFGALLQTHH